MEVNYWAVTCAILVPGIILASWIDYSQRRVPNWLNGGGSESNMECLLADRNLTRPL